MRDSSVIDELDLAIIHAIERSPRAPWALIGSVVGIDATTAARRWERLEATGTAWVTCYPLLFHTQAAAVVAIRCVPGAALRAAEQIACDPQAFFVDITAGAADVLVTAVAASMSSLSAYVLERLGAIEGVISVRTHPVLSVHAEGNFVGAGTLEPVALKQLPESAHGRLTSASGGVDDLDWEICLALSRDGRLPVSALSEQFGVGETTVRRRLTKLERLGALRMMVEVATGRTTAPLTTWCTARIPARLLETAAQALSTMPNIKAVVSVAGPDNLVFKATFRALADIQGFDVRVGELLPELLLTDRSVVLRPIRLMSRLVDADGQARRVVSVDIRP